MPRKLVRKGKVQFVSSLHSAIRNHKMYAAYVQVTGQDYRDALARNDRERAQKIAPILYYWARQAAWAGNLILNNGKPVAQVFAELDAEREAR